MGKNNNNNNRNNNRNNRNSGGGATTNQQIQKAISSAGQTVSYKEAAAVAEKIGVSVDRVYNQTAKTGQGVKAGSAAANAGYTPSSQLKVGNPITSGYVSQYAANQQVKFDEALAAAQAGGVNPDGSSAAEPTFDWDAWNLQMQEQQAAIWASMDAMNAQFLQQQEAWQQQQVEQRSQMGVMTSGGDRRGFAGSIGGNADLAQVKRKKSKKPSTTAAGTKLSIGGGTAAGGVSTGGASAGKTLGIG